ncbi:MAG: VOC family protein [Pseudomonadota bacterium]
MFDHVVFGVSDYEEGKNFFIKVLAPFGDLVVSESSLGVELFRKGDQASLCIRRGAEVATPHHIAFEADNRQQVDAFYIAALNAGGIDNGSPGLREEYHANYYAAFVIGPDGHNIEMVCHAEEN